MKKLFLTLLIAFSFGASSNAFSESGRADTFDYFKVKQAKNTSFVFKSIAPLPPHQGQACEQVCLLEFRSCISSAQGTGAWWYCELTFEACMVDCGY